MGTEQKGVSGLLNRLNKSLNKKGNTNTSAKGGVDYKAQAEARKKAFTKCKEGKNQFVFLVPNHQEDPFFEWGFHQNLLAEPWYTVPCDAHNKGESCVVCNMVDAMKESDWKGNRHIWQPIEGKTEFYAPVINVESEATIAEGPKWLKLTTTMMSQIFEWLNNLEDGEVPFYDEEQPERIIINYSKDADPKSKYKLDKKSREAFSPKQLEAWKEVIQPVQTYFFSKSQDQMKKIAEEYLERIENLAATTTADVEPKEEVIEQTVKSETKAASKLSSLKTGNKSKETDDLPF